jgi:hypothetical protein
LRGFPFMGATISKTTAFSSSFAADRQLSAWAGVRAILAN